MNLWAEYKELGFLARIPIATEREMIGELDGDDWAGDLQRIAEYHPELLTDEGRKFLGESLADTSRMWGEMNDHRDRENKMGRWAPEIEIQDDYGAASRTEEGSISEKQLGYLRTLGVRSQDSLLKNLSKKEASQLIDDVLKLRAENGLPT